MSASFFCASEVLFCVKQLPESFAFKLSFLDKHRQATFEDEQLGDGDLHKQSHTTSIVMEGHSKDSIDAAKSFSHGLVMEDNRNAATESELHDGKLSTSTPDASEFATALESFPSSSSSEVKTRFGDDSSSGSMTVSASNETSSVQSEIEASEVHWSQTWESLGARQHVSYEANKEVFASLVESQSGIFFEEDHEQLYVVGEKIAEGGQAEIFLVGYRNSDGTVDPDGALKVFKEGSALQDLKKQWPPGMLERTEVRDVYNNDSNSTCEIYAGMLLKDGRFAFKMDLYWGDLRKVIDVRMQRKSTRLWFRKEPPFSDDEVRDIMRSIVKGVQALHADGIVHRDLKASNVLVEGKDIPSHKAFDPARDRVRCVVADFECSVGVVGTAFWRAPEILLALKNGDIQPCMFSREADVYSFGMTFYEVLTGLVPLGDRKQSDYDFVLGGGRPDIPEYVKPSWKALLNECWHGDPLRRPTFNDILTYF